MRILVVAFLIMATPCSLCAAERIHFNILSDNMTLAFSNHDFPMVSPLVLEIAMRTLDKPFSPDVVRQQYYQLTVNRGVIWQGRRVVQYDYVPLSGDRFRNVIWVSEDGSGIVKLEIYDTDNRLVFSGLCMDTPVVVQNYPRHTIESFADVKNELYGFTNIFYRAQKDGSLRMAFTDGLNSFSLFRTLLESQGEVDLNEPERFVLYGNNVFNKTVDNYRYTVVGTVPFYKMEEVVMKVIASIDQSPADSTQTPNGPSLIPDVYNPDIGQVPGNVPPAVAPRLQ